jgi:hypothetical protein
MRHHTRLIAAACVGLVTSAWSLRAQAAPSAPPNPLLEQLVGHWRMTGQVRGRPQTYDLVARRVLNGRYVELHMLDVARPAQYEALVYVGEDTLANRVVVHWLDSFGAAFSIPHGQGAVSGDTVRFEIPYPASPFRDTFVYRRSDRSWVFRLESSDGRGGRTLFAEYAVTRLP